MRNAFQSVSDDMSLGPRADSRELEAARLLSVRSAEATGAFYVDEHALGLRSDVFNLRSFEDLHGPVGGRVPEAAIEPLQFLGCQKT